MMLKEKHFRYLLDFIFRHHVKIIIAAVLLSVLSMFIASRIQFKTSFVDLLPEDTPSARDLNSVTEKAGGVGFLLIPLETKKITKKTKEFARKLSDELLKLKEIRYVILNKNKDFLEPRFLYYLDTEDVIKIHDRIATKLKVERKKVNPFYIDLLGEDVPLDFSDIEDKYKKNRNEAASTDVESDYYVNKKGTILALRAKPTKPSSDMKYSTDLINKVEKLINDLDPKSYDPDLEVSVIGRYKTFVEENQILMQDLTRSSIIFIILSFILITAATRKLRSVFLIVTPLLLAISYTAAFATIAIGHVNLITAFLAAVLAGLGIDFGIHLFMRYNFEREKGTDLRESIYAILTSTGKATFTAGMTTSATFFTLTIMDFRGFSEFGLIAGAGILICLFSIYFVLPSLAILLERFSPVKQKKPKENSVTAGKAQKFPFPVATVAVWVIAVIASLIMLPHINFEGDFRKLKAKGRLFDKQDQIEEEVFGAAISPSLIVTEKMENLPKIEKIIKDVKAENEKKSKSYIDQLFHVLNIVPEDQKTKYPYIRELNSMAHDRVLNLLEGKEKKDIDRLKRISSSKPFTLRDIPDDIVSKLRLPDPYNGWFIMMYPKIMDNENLWEVDQAIAFSEETDQIIKKAADEGIKFELVAETLIYADIMKLIISEGPYAVLFALIAVLLLLYIDFRKIRAVVITTIPLVTGILVMFGIMYVVKLDLTFMNAIIFPTLLGIGIDSTVHLYHRYLEEGKGSIMNVLKEVGYAIGLSAATTLIGFGSLATAQNYGLKGIGWLAIIGISCAFVSAITVMPAIIQLLENRKK
ncbi:MAG: MMPL family transporter [Oligoflexia bacterium]|nr:MMPL family transporter [Oligoflexia bacterium]